MNSSSQVSALVVAALAGSRSAFEQLFETHFAAAHAIALARVRHFADAEDVVQIAFMTAVEKLRDCRDPVRFRAWLLQIVRNTAIDSGRSAARSRLRHVDEAPEFAHEAPQAPDVAKHIESRSVLFSALKCLTERQREVLLLHDLEGWKHAEIAELLSISEITSRQELFTARRALRWTIETDREGGKP